MYFYTVLRNLSSPEMITVVLTLPSAPEVGGLDGSGGDTVEVIPTKIRTTAPTMYSIHTTKLACPLLHAVVYSLNYTCAILSLTFHELSHCYRYLPGGREGAGVGVGVDVL